MALLTPGEYDDLPQQAQYDLSLVVWDTTNNKHDVSYRKRYGRIRNGELDADPRPHMIIGYGTGSRKAPPAKRFRSNPGRNGNRRRPIM